MSDQQRYVDEDGNPVDPSELEGYETVPAPAAAPVTPATPAPRGAGAIRYAAVALLVGGLVAVTGVVAMNKGWIGPSAGTTAAPSTTTTATASEPSTSASASAGSSNSASAGSSNSASASTAASSAPVAVDNSRYTGAKWSATSLHKPGVRLRVTDSVKLPSSAGMWDANVARAFNRFAPWVTIAATAPNQITVQTVSRAEVTKSWAETTVDVSGKPRVTGENSGPSVDDSRELVDTDGSPAADTGPDSGKPVSYYVEGGDVPAAAKGKRAGQVSVSVIKRDGKDRNVVWLVAGGVLMKAAVEEIGGASASSTGESPEASPEAKDTEGN